MQFVYPRDFETQFLLADALPANADAARHTSQSLDLDIFGGLPVVRAIDGAGADIGMLLGWPIGPAKSGILNDSVTFDGAATPDAIDQFVEDHIYGLAGSFIFILDMPGVRRVYLDACGTLSAVYDMDGRKVASTALPMMTPEASSARFRADMHATLDVTREGWFPASLTAHEGVNRLLPNFYLDLDTFTTKRHWPTGPIPETDDPKAVAGEILAEIRQNIHAVVRSGPAHMSLTAGNETRLLVAASKDFVDELAFFTTDAPNAEIDRDISLEIAKRYGLNHKLLPIQFADAAKQADWHARTGYAFAGVLARTHPTVSALTERPYYIAGAAGEVGRGFFWRPSDTDATPIDADAIWARFGMPRDAEAVAALEPWLESVKGLPSLLILDLVYLELRMGGWGFAPSYATPRPVTCLPLISRKAFTDMLRMPADWRRQSGGSNRLILEMIRQAWPELLDMPIGRYGDYRDKLRKVQRAIREPHVVMKKLRKMFG